MFIVNVPDHVEHQEAYINATKARIVANALKTFSANNQDVITAVNSGNGSFFDSLRNNLQQYGKLTEKQCQAVRACVAKQVERKALSNVSDNTTSFVGNVGDKKVMFKCTVAKVVAMPSAFGAMFLHVMVDSESNTIVYKGSKELGVQGSTIEFTATIKEHCIYNSKCQTVVQRPVVLSCVDPVEAESLPVVLPVSLPVIDNTQAIAQARQEWKQAVSEGDDELADEKLELYMALRKM